VNNYFSSLEAPAVAAVPETGETAPVEAGEPTAEVAAEEVSASGEENAPDAEVAAAQAQSEKPAAGEGVVEAELEQRELGQHQEKSEEEKS